MTRDEIKVMFAALSKAYPPNLMLAIDSDTINLWTDLLQDLNGVTVLAATKAWAQTNRYPPTIADIREIVTVRQTDDTPEKTWSRLQRAVQRFGHTDPAGAEKALADIWPVVGDDWKYYCTLPEDQLPNEKARFLRMFTAHQKKQKNQAQISGNVSRILADGILRLGEGHD